MWLMPWHIVVAQLMKIPSCNTALLFHLCSSEQPKNIRSFSKAPPYHSTQLSQAFSAPLVQHYHSYQQQKVSL